MITACQKSVEPESSDDTETGENGNVDITVTDVQTENEKDHEDSADYVWDNSQVIPIILNGNSITASTDKAIVNGSIVMTGGEVIINGPTSNNNGAFDYDSSFKLSGGFIITVGSSGMAQAPSTTLTQYTLLLNLKSSQQSNSLLHIQSSDGSDIVTFKSIKKYQSIVFSSAKLTKGSAYDVYFDGNDPGTAIDGLYSGGSYTPGTKFTSFTVSSIIKKLYN